MAKSPRSVVREHHFEKDLAELIGDIEAADDFVADLNEVRRCPGRLQGVDHVGGVGFDLIDERVEIKIGPGGGFVLFLGVGPPIGVMEVEHERSTGIFDAFGEFGGVIEAICAVARVDPNPQSKTRPAILHEQPNRIAGMIAVHINPAPVFDLGQSGDIGAEIKVRRRALAGVHRTDCCDQPEQKEKPVRGSQSEQAGKWAAE